MEGGWKGASLDGQRGRKRKHRKKTSLLRLSAICTTMEIWPDGLRGENNVVRAVAPHLSSPLVLSQQDGGDLAGTAPALPPRAWGWRREGGRGSSGRARRRSRRSLVGMDPEHPYSPARTWPPVPTQGPASPAPRVVAAPGVPLSLGTQTSAAFSALNASELPRGQKDMTVGHGNSFCPFWRRAARGHCRCVSLETGPFTGSAAL